MTIVTVEIDLAKNAVARCSPDVERPNCSRLINTCGNGAYRSGLSAGFANVRPSAACPWGIGALTL
jgi:hypothetical protein